MSAAGKGVASKPDTAFFKQRRACWDKKIQFKYGKSDALSWERKAGDEKYDPSPAAPIDYEKHYRQLQTERAHNKQLRLKNSASTLRLGDHANDYWHSNHELFSGRVTGGELGRQRAENARKKRQLASSTLTLGDDPDYYDLEGGLRQGRRDASPPRRGACFRAASWRCSDIRSR